CKYNNISPTTEEKVELNITAFFKDINVDRVASPRLTVKVEALNNYVVSSFEKIFNHLKINKTNEMSDDVPCSKGLQVNDDGENTPGLGDNDDFDNSHDAAPPPSPRSNDEELAKIQMSQLVPYVPRIIEVEEQDNTPDQLVRQRLPGIYGRSLFLIDFYSGASNISPKCIFDIKHLFTVDIDDFDPLSSLAQEF
ncbi:hypothetical protein HAX54_042547, partial [Datura stramonium]|nr:hypothetical protein [Datura stramonium]